MYKGKLTGEFILKIIDLGSVR